MPKKNPICSILTNKILCLSNIHICIYENKIRTRNNVAYIYVHCTLFSDPVMGRYKAQEYFLFFLIHIQNGL